MVTELGWLAIFANQGAGPARSQRLPWQQSKHVQLWVRSSCLCKLSSVNEPQDFCLPLGAQAEEVLSRIQPIASKDGRLHRAAAPGWPNCVA